MPEGTFSDVAARMFSSYLYTIIIFHKLARILTLLLLNTACPVLVNSVDPDQLASEQAN